MAVKSWQNQRLKYPLFCYIVASRFARRAVLIGSLLLSYINWRRPDLRLRSRSVAVLLPVVVRRRRFSLFPVVVLNLRFWASLCAVLVVLLQLGRLALDNMHYALVVFGLAAYHPVYLPVCNVLREFFLTHKWRVTDARLVQWDRGAARLVDAEATRDFRGENVVKSAG